MFDENDTNRLYRDYFCVFVLIPISAFQEGFIVVIASRTDAAGSRNESI